MRKIGLLLGSFDPITIGHSHMISCVLNSKLCDEVMLVVAKQNPWKHDDSTDFNIRCEMAIAAVMQRFDYKVSVCFAERDIEPPTYSYKVLDKIRKAHKNDELYIICGSDVYEKIEYWKEFETKIKPFFKFIHITRGKDAVDGKNLFEVEDFKDDNGKVTATIRTKVVDISSSMVRQLIHEGLNPFPYITYETYNIIKHYKLYG